MTARGDIPFLLRENRVSYLIPGGDMLDIFYGHPPNPETMASQAWIASVVESSLHPGQGLSRLAQGGELLRDVLARQGRELLGDAHVARWGNNPGILLKLLHSRQRLLVQTHPDKERASRWFASPFGKTEAWYIVQTRPDRPAHIYAGFLPQVTREYFRERIERQDTAAILGCLHRFAVSAGDVIFIPAGLPHAMGPDCLAAEIQEPTDITLRAERIRPDGSVLPEESLHSGIGMEGLLDCFDFDGKSRDDTRRDIFVEPQIEKGDGFVQKRLITPAQTDCFAMSEIGVRSTCTGIHHSFAVGLVLEGEGRLLAGGEALALRRGSEVFFPAGVREYTYQSDEGMRVLECFPPPGEVPNHV